MKKLIFKMPSRYLGSKHLTWVLAMLISLSPATGLYASETQDTSTLSISLSVNKKPLKDAFKQLQEVCDCVVFVYDKDIDEKQLVSVNTKDASLPETLDLLLKDTDNTYAIDGKQVYIKKTEASPKSLVYEAKKTEDDKITISGKIIDELDVPIIGAAVAMKGTSVGTATDLDGNFTLKDVKEGAQITISYVGYNTQTIIAKKGQSYHLKMEPDVQMIEEVVVVGYGTQKKVNLTGSIATIDKKMLEDRPMSNVSAGLAGLLPGVSIVQKGGMPGHDEGTIRVRGVGTFNNSDPMVIIDGIESTMAGLDANDIESLTVLKDAASAAIYGSKAANGVILITTKRGKEGKTQISYSGNIGWQTPTDKPKYMGSLEYAQLYNEALGNDGKAIKWQPEDFEKFKTGSSPDTHPDTDWQSLFYKGSGMQTGHNVNVAGGNATTRYMTSLGYLQQDGVIKNTGKKQYNLRSNIDIKAASNLDIGVNVSYTRMDLEEPTNSYVGGGADQIFRQVNLIAPWIPYKTSDGNYGTIGDGNPIAWMDIKQQIKRQRAYFTGIGSVNYRPIKDLSLKGVLAYKTYNQDENEFRKDIQYNPTKYHGPNKMYQKDTSHETVSTDLFATYEKTLAEKHNFSVLGGFHSEYYHYKYREAYRQNFPSNAIGDINGGNESGMSNAGYTRELSMLSWFGRATYNYDSRYLLEANVRYDGTSRFAKENRWGAFPSFSAAWRISEEAFMEPMRSSISNLKLRASWGKLGNQSAKDDYYPTIYTMNIDKAQSYPLGGTIEQGAATRVAKNPNLKWESSRTWDFGLDFGLVNGLNISIDYYDRLTTDILMQIPTPDTYALDDYWANVGEVVNRGIELSVDYNKQINQVRFSVGANAAYNKNKITYLGGQDQFFDKDDDKLLNRLGNPINSIYGYKTDGLYRSEEDIANWAESKLGLQPQRGDLRYVDTSGDEMITSADQVLIGCSDPKVTLGFNLAANYKGFDILAFFQGALGGKGYLSSEAFGDLNGDSGKPTIFWRDRWTPDNMNASIPRVSSNGKSSYSSASRTSSYWLQNGNYLRMKNLQFGYTIPTSITRRMQIEKIRLYYSAQNLFTITNFAKGWDPEAPLGRGSHYPQVMVNSFGINVTF